MTKMVSRLSQASHQETNYLRNSLEAFSPQLQTLLVLLSRSLKKTEKGLQLSKISYQ